MEFHHTAGFLALKVKTATLPGKDRLECEVYLRVSAYYKREHGCKCHIDAAARAMDKEKEMQQVSTLVLTESEPC